MQPINIDDNLHKKLKLQAISLGEKMYNLMNKYAVIGLWYDSLPKDQKQTIDEEVEKFLIDKEK